MLGMTDKRSSQTRNALRICDFLMIAAVLFVVITALAMLLYPGGYYPDKESSHYSLTRNFFSDLGATRTYSHAANGASMILFIVSLALVGISLILFSLNYRVIYGERKRGLLVGQLAVAAAVLSGVSFIGIAANPMNINLSGHLLMVQQAFISLVLFIFLILTLQLLNGWPWRWIVVGIVYVVLLAGYQVMMRLGSDIGTSEGLMLQALAQKVFIYASIIVLGFEAYGMRGVILKREKGRGQYGE